MVKSRFSILTIPLVCVLTVVSIQVLYTIYNIVADNLSNLTDLGVVIQLGTLTLTDLFLLTMLKRNTRSYVIHQDKLDVNYFFGLVTKSYDFRDLKFSYYTWTKKVGLVELPDRSQVTLGKSQYSNFDEIVEILATRIQNQKLKFKFVNKLTVFIIVASLLFFLMIIQMGKG
jgi:hypothetical protein